MSRVVPIRFSLVASLCLGVGGCVQWTVARGPAPQAVRAAMQRSERSERPIRVELVSGPVVAVTGAFVRNDSLIGTVPAARRKEAGALVPNASPVGYAFADIRRVEYQRVRAGPTVAYYARSLAFAVVGAIAILIIALANADLAWPRPGDASAPRPACAGAGLRSPRRHVRLCAAPAVGGAWRRPVVDRRGRWSREASARGVRDGRSEGPLPGARRGRQHRGRRRVAGIGPARRGVRAEGRSHRRAAGAGASPDAARRHVLLLAGMVFGLPFLIQ